MNISTRTRIIGSAASLGLLVALSACGTETVTDPGSGAQPGMSFHHPRTGHAQRVGISADSAERQAQADKARAERADALRAAHGQQVDNRLDSGNRNRR